MGELVLQVLVPEGELFVELLSLLKGVDVLLELGVELAVVEDE